MKKTFIFFIDLYQLLFSKTLIFLFGGGCRFALSCSDYSKKAIERYGVSKGVVLSLKRFLKCHPFSKADYYEHV